MATTPSERHTFLPSRPGGTVCVNIRRYDAALNETEVCGFPAGHPIHESTGAGVSDGELTARQHAEILRPWVRQMPGGGSQHLDQLLSLVERSAPNTPAEALADVAEMRQWWPGSSVRYQDQNAMLDRIEAALRAGGAA